MKSEGILAVEIIEIDRQQELTDVPDDQKTPETKEDYEVMLGSCPSMI